MTYRLCQLFFTWLVLCLVSVSLRVANAQAQTVSMVKQHGTFQLLRNGEPYAIRGVGGDVHLDLLAELGGNSIRTWDSKNLGRVLDEAHKRGLTVCAGLWLGHQRHGFDYQNQDAVLQQLDEKLAAVKRYKDHPALLLWAVGNEMEGEGRDPSVWYAVNHLAREIKRLDPNHPTMTVIAELGENAGKVRSIERFCPDIDIVGINAYGGIESVAKRFLETGSSKPYIITEHGTLGPWEVGTTTWGAPIEQTSTQKATWYAKGYQQNVIENADNCLGSYAFLWGHKQETTATWFGMLLPDGTRLGAADALSELWSGKPLKNRCPEIASFRVDRDSGLEKGDVVHAMVKTSDPDGDAIKYRWILRSDSATIGEGGDPQESETAFADAVKSNGATADVTMPESGGGYRLFVYVYDNHGGAAVANIPLHIPAPIKLQTAMKASPLPYAIYADDVVNSPFVPSGYMGNAGAISQELDCTDDPHQGDRCLKASYASGASWGGVLWQSPAGDWDGKQPGGANLTGATHLEFWARGANGGETVNFVFGVLDGNQPYRDTAKGELKDVRLTTAWNKYTIPLRGLDLRQIKTGFGWSLAGQGKPVTFFLDDIRYVKEE